MLFDQLPPGLLAFLMMVSCAIKHTAIVRLAHTQWFQQKMQGPRWWHAVLTMAVCGGAMIYLIVDKFVGWPKALYLAGADVGLNAAAGWFVYRVELFSLEEPERTRVIIWIRTTYISAYASYIWHCLG
jgi:hypothetical protein